MFRLRFRLLAGLVLLLLIPGCGGSLDSRPTEEANGFVPEAPPRFRHDGVRVATLNAEFMFDGVAEEGGATFPHKDDPALARVHRDRIGAIVRMLDADVLLLQEIEHAEVLEMLVAESLPDLGYTVHFVQGRDSFTGQDVGLLARVPIEEVGRTDERAPVEGTTDTYGVSKNLYARLELAGLPVTLIGVHFLSQASNVERRPRREAQAEVIRRLAEAEAAAGRALVVLGDFNDYDPDIPDAIGSEPVTDVLRLIKAVGPGEADDLYNVMAEVPQADRYTNLWDKNRNEFVDPGEFSAIDHILLSPALADRVEEVYYVQAHNPFTHSDHFPIVVTLSTP